MTKLENRHTARQIVIWQAIKALGKRKKTIQQTIKCKIKYIMKVGQTETKRKKKHQKRSHIRIYIHNESNSIKTGISQIAKGQIATQSHQTRPGQSVATFSIHSSNE